MVGARGGWAPNWKRFSVGEGRHQSERSVSKETWRRALVWRGPQAPMGLLGKGAGAQRRYTIERRYQRFLDSPWPTPQLNIFTRAGPSPVHVSDGTPRAHVAPEHTLCIARSASHRFARVRWFYSQALLKRIFRVKSPLRYWNDKLFRQLFHESYE